MTISNTDLTPERIEELKALLATSVRLPDNSIDIDAPYNLDLVLGVVRDLLAHPTHYNPTGGEGETAWLIERAGQWYAAGPHSKYDLQQFVDPGLWRENWTDNANDALWFARQSDAETLIKSEGWQHATATEHKFLSRHPLPPPYCLDPKDARIAALEAALSVSHAAALQAGDAIKGALQAGVNAGWAIEGLTKARAALARSTHSGLAASVLKEPKT